jgi:predicted TIM-barrel fold metal-dependent hydrolase
MLGDMVVVNGVVHPYNFARENLLPHAERVVDVVYLHHEMWSGPGYTMPRERFFTDFDLDAFTASNFAESPVDLAVIHALPGQNIVRDEPRMVDRMAALRDTHPDRYLLYGTLMTPNLADARVELRRQVEELGIIGIKFYPVFSYQDVRYAMRMDDPEVLMPLLETALDLGIRNVAVHKAIHIGHVPYDPYRIDDIEVPAAAFPDLNIQIVHAGVTFLEETCLLLHRFPNVFANLEIPWSYVHVRPRVFAEMLGEMLYWGTPEQIIYGDGNNLVHPRPALEDFAAFQMPDDLVTERGYRKLTNADKALIVGGNFARLHGIDLDAAYAKIRDDEFDKQKANGYLPPWSGFRDA